MFSDSDYKHDLKTLLTKRSSIKGRITKFKNYIDTISIKEDLSPVQLSELSIKLEKFRLLATHYEQLQDSIDILNSDNLALEINERDAIEQDCATCIAIAQTIITDSNSHKEEQNTSSSSRCHHDHFETEYKLPQLQINKFDGTYFRWLEFRDTFLSVIHSNDRIKPIHKFHYLTSYLEGDAARIISNIEVSEANYNDAWRLLCERYDNKRQLINHHLNALFKIDQLNRESERSLRFLVDHVTKNLRALCSLGQPTQHWDTLIIHIVSSKLDTYTLAKWEEMRGSLDEVPTLAQFNKFLTDRADILETLHRNKVDRLKTSGSSSRPTGSNFNSERAHTKSFTSLQNNSNNFKACVICNRDHKIYECEIFKRKNFDEKVSDVHRLKLCMNCLRGGHQTYNCKLGPCRICKKKHNTLLHQTKEVDTNSSSLTATSTNNTISNFSMQPTNQAILSTALIKVCNPKTNKSVQVRALLDCGSQSSFISKQLKEYLSLESSQINKISVIGIGNNSSNHITESCIAQFNSIPEKYCVTLACFVLKELTGSIPAAPINLNNLKLPQNLKLADPNFNIPSSIDVIIGADLFWDVLGNDNQSLGPGLKLRSSKLGWLITGAIPTNLHTTKKIQSHNSVIVSEQDESIQHLLQKFWSIEEVPHNPILTKIEKTCEQHFVKHTIRLPTGRFSVQLPLIDTPDCLGDSYKIALERFFNLEKRFRRNLQLKTEYCNFIQEYFKLGHLEELVESRPPVESYFLCHHAVFKETSESTKIRVVFDGSVPTTSGYSLNDIQMIGPNIQDLLFSILIRARQYKFLLTADIEKMYRQIKVHDDHQNLQLILWRENEIEPIKILRLKTVTYGLASSSFLSTRCLWQLGQECTDKSIETIIKHDFYVDDLITGANSKDELLYIQTSVSNALKKGCFNLRKYKSNCKYILNSDLINRNDKLSISSSISALGINWDPNNDSLQVSFEVPPKLDFVTKRLILSFTFKIFDPMGLISPCVVLPKLILQSLWQRKLDWDVPVPKDIQNSWNEFTSDLSYLLNLQVPRRVVCDNYNYIELHSFSDASQRAYGACIYLRSINEQGLINVQLLCSKSKIAPLKPTTIPRLELCAALLAAKLSKVVISSLRCVVARQVHWCDSTVVLGWLRTESHKLKTFVANRVVEISELTDVSSWRYIPTLINPADFISRGLLPKDIVTRNLWWYGPEFLLKIESEWPIFSRGTSDDANLPEIKLSSALTVAVATEEPTLIEFEKYSKFVRIQRVLGYVKRFIFNLRNKTNKRTGSLSLDELKDSFHNLCVISQKQSFPKEYYILQIGKAISSKSTILPLTPFFDYNLKLIRVGGRLNNSDYNFDKKHPILLHSTHHLTKLIFEREHLRYMHAGPQLLLSVIRDSIWPINGRRLARNTVHKCVTCRRHQGRAIHPIMGNLPVQRVTPDFPFKTVGVDFAGPFYILNKRGRGARTIKAYLCLFICFRFKCLHLEAVSDLSKEGFLQAFRRFISRRGKPIEVYCDNGKNFVAAAKEIGTFLKTNKQQILDFATEDDIKFIFSPTHAPHFGGIWEAGVKSAKHHIRRVMGNTHLTFEELGTLFAEVEAILNSRPLYPLSSNPNDYRSLTPGHFLIGRPLRSLNSPSLLNFNTSQLQRYARIEQIRQHFWQRWQKEYVSELQQRSKWRTNSSKLQEGDLVLLIEDNLPPLCWKLARISRLFPGSDAVARVAEVRTCTGTYRRPLTKLCPLLTGDDMQG